MFGMPAVPTKLADLLFGLAAALAGAIFLVFVIADGAVQRRRHRVSRATLGLRKELTEKM
jgi:hypothetical protein